MACERSPYGAFSTSQQAAGRLDILGPARGIECSSTSWPSLKTSFLPCASVTLYARVARDSAEAAVRARGVMGKDGRFDIAVTFDERRGYVGTHPERERRSQRSRSAGCGARSRQRCFPKRSSLC
jgi:hypothetical protein